MQPPLGAGADLCRGRHAGRVFAVAAGLFVSLLTLLGVRAAVDRRAAPTAATPAACARTPAGSTALAAGAGRRDPAKGPAGGPRRRAVVQPASRADVTVARTRFGAEAAAKRNAWFATARGDGAFARLGEPRSGDWLAEFPERGQTLAEYLRAGVNRKNAVRVRLHLQPFADLRPQQRAVLAAVREVAAAWFDTDVVILPERRPAPIWYNQVRRQWDADVAVGSLARQVPGDSLGVLGVMGGDLYGLRLNFIFGVGLMRERAALYSLHRYDTRDERLLLRRTIKVALHELGHVLTLQHCVFYRCVMNGSNSLAEMDGQPLHACPVCLSKLRANLRFDPRARYERLEAVYRRLGLAEEAAFVHARRAELAAR